MYKSGDVSDAIYIINRGALEVVHEASAYAARTPISYLSRGDVFGETETLSDVPRKNAIRTCEPASIQLFPKKNFPELIRRVPKFFYYLSQQIATQVAQDHRSGIRAEFIVWNSAATSPTSTWSRSTRRSSIPRRPASYRPSSMKAANAFEHVFLRGTARAKFGHVTIICSGEEAFWQLVPVRKAQRDVFVFHPAEQTDRGVRPRQVAIIRRNPTDLLITGAAIPGRVSSNMLEERCPEPDIHAACGKSSTSTGPTRSTMEHCVRWRRSIWQLCYSSAC